MADAIVVEGLEKSFGDQRVLDGIRFSVARGSIVALLGENGAGKTTTLRILTTVTPADAGRVAVAGHDVASAGREVRRRISATGQNVSVDATLTGAENLELMGELRGLSRRDARVRAQELLERSGLSDAGRKRVRTYSGGMRRRLDLALSMVAPADVVFLDEPTTGLDTRARSALWERVRELAEAGAAVLVTTQYLEEADALADRVLVLHRGRIVAEGTPAELKARMGGATVAVVDGDGAEVDSEGSDGTAAGLRDALARLEARGALGADSVIAVHAATLDDVFRRLTDDDGDEAPR
ncbi:ABC transporter ATP-binding protein [Demequina mangrovi]|uniref:ABC-2 type transport system ATP-binding protein n=1 Tax=Demequina mangrovi TaxID=1043493 RepID=A0A1H6ZVV2_9MICO|nr:ABC transporter ATP-binding protein [Demequina mangrovi]SEJ57471.1 ABC-2 type transport system ATP-binding protein [Demequina mangrovi]